MNEKAVFFFSGAGKKKNSSEIEWMNGKWTFPGKEKKTKKKHTHTPIFTNIGKIKNRNSHKNRSPISAFGFYFSLVTRHSLLPKIWKFTQEPGEIFTQKGLIWHRCTSPSPDLEWMANELFRGKKKKHAVFFFYRNFGDLGNKKKHGFWLWMNEWITFLSA